MLHNNSATTKDSSDVLDIAATLITTPTSSSSNSDISVALASLSAAYQDEVGISLNFVSTDNVSVSEDYTSVRVKTLSLETQEHIRVQLLSLDQALNKMEFTKEIDSTGLKTNVYILNLRRKELDAAVPHLRKVNNVLVAIENQQLLLANLYKIKLALQEQLPDQANSLCYYPPQIITDLGYTPDVMKRLQSAVISARSEILALASPILINVGSPKKIKQTKLLTEVCVVLHDFYLNPHDANNATNLLDTANRIHRKLGSYWRPLVQALGLVIAAAGLTVAFVGIIPSIFIASAVAVFSFVVVLAVANSLRIPLNKNTAIANHLSNELRDISKLGKHLTFFKKAIDMPRLRRSASDSELISSRITPARMNEYSESTIAVEKNRQLEAKLKGQSAKPLKKKRPLQLIQPARNQGLFETTSAHTFENAENYSVRPYFKR